MATTTHTCGMGIDDARRVLDTFEDDIQRRRRIRQYKSLLDAWQPAEGTPLHWSLAWLIENETRKQWLIWGWPSS